MTSQFTQFSSMSLDQPRVLEFSFPVIFSFFEVANAHFCCSELGRLQTPASLVPLPAVR